MKEWLAISIAFAAFAVSAISAWVSHKRNLKAEHVSVEALDTAKKANEIASAALLRMPIVSLKLLTEPPVFDKAWVNAEVIIEVVNKSDIPIGGAVVKINPLSGYLYRNDNPEDSVESLPVASLKYSFHEVLLKNGAAHIEVAPFLLSLVKDNVGEFNSPNSVYHGTFNVVVAPIQEGREIGVSTRHYGSKDYCIVNIKFVPAVLESLPLDKLIVDAERRIKIFSGYPDIM